MKSRLSRDRAPAFQARQLCSVEGISETARTQGGGFSGITSGLITHVPAAAMAGISSPVNGVDFGMFAHRGVRGPGWNDPMTAVVPRVKGFACYGLSFSRHNKNIKMEHFFLYILSRYFI